MGLEERRFRLTLHYDGSEFFGWQAQPKERTVQGELERTLERLTGAHRTVTAAGRTDRGVHATGQVAAVLLPRRWTAATLRRALNARLPEDVWVAEVHPAPLGFHPRYDATARAYGYRLGLAAASWSPFHRGWCWPVARTGAAPAPAGGLDADALAAAAALLPGEKSFAAFARAGQEKRGDRCRVAEARWVPWGLGLEFAIVANRFLHRMVRYLVGTMVDVARGRRPLDDMRAMLAGDGRGPVTSPPAPAAGLFLRDVRYPERSIAPHAALPDASAPDPGPTRAAEAVPRADSALLDFATDRPHAGSPDRP